MSETSEKMASIFEKKLFFKSTRKWDAKTKLNEVYKLQSNDLRNKYKAEIPKDLGSLRIEFTLNRTITDFIRGTKRVNLDYVKSFAEYGNVLQGRLLSDWKQVLVDNFPEPVNPETALLVHNCSMADSFQHAIDLFLKHTLNEKKPCDRQWIYMSPGGGFGVRKDILVSSMDHLHWFKEMLRILQMLPEGDIPTPNAVLQVEWFYMSFHRTDCAEYLRSGRKHCNETLATLADYFESVFNAQVANGMLRKLRDKQVVVKARNEYHHKLQACYHDKLKCLADGQRHEHSWRRNRNGSNHDGKSCKRTNYRKRKTDNRNHGNRKTLHVQPAKKPCHVHGLESKHSYDKCHASPKN